MNILNVERYSVLTIEMFDYDDSEPYIVLMDNDDGDEIAFSLESFVELLDDCKRLGVNCEHLEEHLQQFKDVVDLHNRMLPEQHIPAGM